LTPPETWKKLFEMPPPDKYFTPDPESDKHENLMSTASLFTPSRRPAHLEILRILDENPPDTISIIAIGPLTNLALAASHAPQTLMRAKSVLVMGGAVGVPGNMTPLAEFNTYADATAAARLYALTSPNPATTLPPSPPSDSHLSYDHKTPLASLPPYPSTRELGDRRLKVVLFPLDITNQHVIRRDEFLAKIQPLMAKSSPLAEWANAFMNSTFRKMETLHHGHEGGSTSMSLHDPLCVWYALANQEERKKWSITEGEDIRVEVAGQWTRGACIVDRRDRKKTEGGDGEGNDIPGDTGGWLSAGRGNRLGRCTGTPGEKTLASFMLETIFA